MVSLNPLVSVIIRTKDRPQLLSAALKSVRSQTYPNVEIVLVNDGGMDVKELSESIAGEMPLSYIPHPVNRGRAAAANSGLSAARGKYLNFLDDDDIFYPHHILTLATFLEEYRGAVAYCSVRNVFYEGTPAAPGNRVRDEIIFNQGFDADRLLFENYIPLMGVMFSRHVLEKVSGFDEGLDVFEDWDFWMRLSRFFDFHHLDHITAEYRFYGKNDVENSHRQKYGYDQALGVMFEKAIPYLSGRAWLNFLDAGLAGRLKQQHIQTSEALQQLTECYQRLNDAHARCIARANDLQTRLDALQNDCTRLADQIAALRGSLSWRITAPFRWMRQWAGGRL